MLCILVCHTARASNTYKSSLHIFQFRFPLMTFIFVSESVGSVDSDSESDGGEDLPRQWETTDTCAQLSKEASETGTDDIPYIGTDVQYESEEENAKSQDLAGNNTNQSNNVLLTAQVRRTPLHCHHPLPIVRLLQRRTALSSSSGRYPQFV